MDTVARADASRRGPRTLERNASFGAVRWAQRRATHAVAAPGSPCDVPLNHHLPQKSLKGAGGG